MTPHQIARRARKSAAFFAKRAEAALAAGNRVEAGRLTEVAQKKAALFQVARVAKPAPTDPRFHSRLMAALDEAQKAGATLSPAHGAIRRAVREANMAGRQFQSAAELVAAVGKFSPWLRTEAAKVADAA